MGPLNDVEFTKYDLTGLKLSVRYNDSAVKTVAAESNALVGWSVKPGVDTVYPGKNTLLATFCGKNAEFEVNFITEPIYSKGDVSMDGKINSYDALLVLQHTTRSITLNAQKAALADVNSDSNINSTDALIILQYVVGITTTL